MSSVYIWAIFEVDPGFGTTGLATLLYAPSTEGAGYEQEGSASD